MSFCKIIRRNGTSTIIKDLIRDEIKLCVFLVRLNIFASARAVINFANSEGCILKSPILNHEEAPPISSVNNTAISDIMVIPYNTNESVSKNLQSIIRIINATNREIPIKKSCLPYFVLKSKTEVTATCNRQK